VSKTSSSWFTGKYFYGCVISLTYINSQCDRKQACNYQSDQILPYFENLLLLLSLITGMETV
jgi:hypothetical protein